MNFLKPSVAVSAEFKAFAPIAALLSSVALLGMGNGLQGTLLPVRAQVERFGTLEVGILGASYFLGFAAGCVLGPYVVRRVGHIRTFTAMVSLASAAVLAHAVILIPAVWWLCRALTGLCLAMLFMVIESWLNEKATNENRGFTFSIYTIISLTVAMIGQMMLTLDDPGEFGLFAAASILVSLAALPVALTRAEAPAPLSAVRIRIAHLFACSPVGFVGAATVGLTGGAFWSLAPVFVHSHPFSEGSDTVAAFMSVAVVAGAIGQWPLGRMSDRMDRRGVALRATIGAAMFGAAMAMFGEMWAGGLFVFCFLFGFFSIPLYTLCAAHMNDSVETGGFVEASSGLLLVYAAGAVGGSVLGSLMMRLLGPNGLFYFTATVHGAFAVFVVVRMRLRPPPQEHQREPFADSIRLAHTVAIIDPLGTETENGAVEEAQGTPQADATEPGGQTRGTP